MQKFPSPASFAVMFLSALLASMTLSTSAAATGTEAKSSAATNSLEARRASIMQRSDELVKNTAEQGESERLNAFFDLYFEYLMLDRPEFATMIGVPGDHDRWSDNSLAADDRRLVESEKALEVMKSIDRGQLEGQDRLNYDLIVDQLEQGMAGERFQEEYLVLNQMDGIQQNVPRLLAMMPARNPRDYDNIMGRLRGVAEQVEQTLERLEKGLEKGITPPQVTLREVPQQVLNVLPENAADSPMLNAFRKMPESIPAAEQDRLRQEASEIFEQSIRPAFERLHGFLAKSYLPGSRQSIGMKDLPDGQDWYTHRVRQMTTTDMTPRQIHDLGLSEVARIRGEMDRVIRESGFEGTFEEFTEFLRTDRQFYFDDPEALLAAYRDISKRADGELPKLFGHLPRTPYGVVPVPEYAEKSQTTAYYEPGSLDAGRSGNFFANTYKLETRPKWEMEALTLHEAVPGHHLQIAIGQELEDMAWFRRFGFGYTAYVEGWGLYAESLGEEMGFYKDPYSKFGQLTYEMWRAIRLVVDTGMHSLGWSRQQAIDYFVANTGKSEHDIVVEVDRYIVWPGQALAYKVGELKIKELRALAEKKLGDQFDIRAFHDTLLGNGALPLAVLELQIREWIDVQKQAVAVTPVGP